MFMLLNIGSAFADTPQRPKNVQTALRAKWSGTPLLLEAAYVLVLPFSNILCVFVMWGGVIY